jgi:hypothetical protein
MAVIFSLALKSANIRPNYEIYGLFGCSIKNNPDDIEYFSESGHGRFLCLCRIDSKELLVSVLKKQVSMK